jgi:hypothetical protein
MSVETVPTVGDLRSLVGAALQTAVLECYEHLGDGGGGIFAWNTSLTLIDDGGTIFTTGNFGHPGSHGCWQRIYSGALDALWFGLDPTGSTANDAAHTRMLGSAAAAGAGFFYPAGTYLFADTIGPWPYGARIFGAGLSNGVAHPIQYGTTFQFSGNGVGVELGHSADANNKNGSTFEGIELIGVNPNGAENYPNINEIGIEILNDGEIVIRNCRVGGFKFSISLDGAEVCAIEACSFDGEPPPGRGYPESDLAANLGANSAFAIRLGTWKSNAGLACNQNSISNCQFNNTGWGILHNGGQNHRVKDCNFECNNGIAILTEANFLIVYENITGEGATVSNFLTTGAGNYMLTLKNVTAEPKVPLLTLGGPQYGLNLYGNDVHGSLGPPVVGSGYVLGGTSLGNLGPWGTGKSTTATAGVMFDADPIGIIERGWSQVEPSTPALGINCRPLSPVDINGNRIRIRNSYTPSSSSDPFGNSGDMCWDDGHIYVKTAAGWMRASLSAF